MSTNPTSVDAFDEEEPFPTNLTYKEVDLTAVSKENLKLVLDHKRREARIRAIRKVLLAIISQVPFIITLIKGML